MIQWTLNVVIKINQVILTNQLIWTILLSKIIKIYYNLFLQTTLILGQPWNMRYIYIDTNSCEWFKITTWIWAKNNANIISQKQHEKTRKTKVSHLQARRDDDGVEEDQRWALEMKNKWRTSKKKLQEQQWCSQFQMDRGEEGAGL